MLGHSSGMIGFPLRLLARENYDRVVKLKGARQVALVTGEEKILPPTARYFLCTVESMPLDKPVEFLAVDEIQLCADPERGHVFTDRLLHARGIAETMFLGSDTIRPLLRSLVPDAQFNSRPRFSTLTYTGEKKVTRLPARAAAVAFSASEVYQLAELLRRQRGGTAVVLGALSPRARNAQVDMFEAGEVDYLVATDAIGMGLNLNLDHVAFARLSKFDGRAHRRLAPTEVAQIAGRAGRHMSDGTFGTTADAGAIPPEVVEQVENHEFDALRALYWRSRAHDFSSAKALLRSLERPPPTAQLMRAPPAEDHQALARLAGQPDIAELAGNPAAVRLLWEVCQIPDFRKILSDHHARLIAQIYRHLMGAAGHGSDGRLAGDWVAGHLKRIDRQDGDIDTLVQRIAHVRTWTYITHRADWLDDPRHWQERARAIEDRLSDALHDRLTQRFVDRRTATLVRRLAEGGDLLGAVRRNGEVLVEGEHVGTLDGFRFTPDAEVKGEDARPLMAAARRALSQEIPRRCRQLEADDDGSFILDDGAAGGGRILWRGAPVARLLPGADVLAPEVRALDSDFLDGPQRQRIAGRAGAWLDRYLANRLQPLHALAAATREGRLQGTARGIAYQLVEALGCLPRHGVAAQVDALSRAERKVLSDLGVRIGRESLFQPAGLKPEAARLKSVLLACHRREAPPDLATLDSEDGKALAPVATPPRDADMDTAMAQALGYLRLEPRAGRQARKRAAPVLVRADRMEQIVQAAFRASKAARQTKGRFEADGKLLALAGGEVARLSAILRAAGFHVSRKDDTLSVQPKRARPAGKSSHSERSERSRGSGRQSKRSSDAHDERRARPDSPFAKLREWQAAE